jgi:ubiquinone/menaquinone biosynthesis C-methylase UbiE
MEALLEQIREQQEESWNKFSPGCKKWDELTFEFLKPVSDEIIRLLDPSDDDIVLDVAAGTGEPGLTIATLLKKGQVVSTDLAEGMLVVAAENALRRGIKNFETQKCDVCELPFADNSFDKVSCRFGFMFFPDMQLAAREIVRVLKPGGRIATSVWCEPEKNLWVTAIMSVINKIMDIPPPSIQSPGMFRCAKTGMIASIFVQAGLKKVSETRVNSKLNVGTKDRYWDYTTEAVAPVVAALSRTDDFTKGKIKKEVLTLINNHYPDDQVRIDANALVIYGQK